jgi:hypothetical protein
LKTSQNETIRGGFAGSSGTKRGSTSFLRLPSTGSVLMIRSMIRSVVPPVGRAALTCGLSSLP